MPRSAVFRLALGYALAFALATALLGMAVYRAADHALRREFDDRISAEASSLTAEYRGEGETALRDVIRGRERARATRDLAYALFAADGRQLAGSLVAARPRPGWQTLVFRDPVEGEDSARALAVDLAPDRRLVVAADWDTLNQLDTLILSLLAAALAAMMVLGTLGTLGLTAYLRARLAVIAGGAEKIIAGDLAQRIPVGARHDEFDRLAMVLNAMLDQIGTLLDNLRQVSADVAHDLRAPLNRLRNRLERSLAEGPSAVATEQAIERTDQLLSVFSAILRLSEIETGQLRRSFTSVDLSALAAEIAESFSPVIEDGGRAFAARIAPTPPVQGDRELLAQALINLLDNAQIHTPDGIQILLSVADLGDRIVLAVADNGPGVSEADRARIAGRFVRLEASRHRPGHGLGLSLVVAIARMHGATLAFASNAPGLIATLEFPR